MGNKNQKRFFVALKLAIFSALLLFLLMHFGSISLEPVGIGNLFITQDYRWVALVTFFTTFAVSWFFEPEGYIGEKEDNIASVFSITVMGWTSALIAMDESVRGMEWAANLAYPAPIIGTIFGFLFGSVAGAFGGLFLALILGYATKGILWLLKVLCKLLLS